VTERNQEALGQNVLIADDEKRIREVVEYALEKDIAGELRVSRGFAEKGVEPRAARAIVSQCENRF
jgi:hypothetical protein